MHEFDIAALAVLKHIIIRLKKNNTESHYDEHFRIKLFTWFINKITLGDSRRSTH